MKSPELSETDRFRVGLFDLGLTTLPLLSNLVYFALTAQEYGCSKILDAIATTNSEILFISKLICSTKFIGKLRSLVALSIINCDLDDLFQLFNDKSTLTYLRIEYLYNDNYDADNKWNLIQVNTIHLKYFTINNCRIELKFIQFMLNKMKSLKLFSISASQADMINAETWKFIIEHSLINLKIFRFCFDYNNDDVYDEKIKKIKQFQTEFWWKNNWNLPQDDGC
ncbi:unnamed protein product [Adineta steineri]|uniref:Uncharacterized protein n=1 Tax=Adineta steineri TaxID=433720 RepID=A0A814N7W5_9BILA|nr:unnamed protein product [Adineta steineri]CAF1089655.1 unnamed protein product [Adineta steineri]